MGRGGAFSVDAWLVRRRERAGPKRRVSRDVWARTIDQVVTDFRGTFG